MGQLPGRGRGRPDLVGRNALGYSFGYSDYYQPLLHREHAGLLHRAGHRHAGRDGARRRQSAGQAGCRLPPGVSPEAVAKFDQARAAFYEGRYDEALKLTDAALAQLPRDAVLHEFRSLVLFALRRFAESAAAIHPVLDVGPGWDWKTLSSLYPNVDVYANQLRALEGRPQPKPEGRGTVLSCSGTTT